MYEVSTVESEMRMFHALDVTKLLVHSKFFGCINLTVIKSIHSAGMLTPPWPIGEKYFAHNLSLSAFGLGIY